MTLYASDKELDNIVFRNLIVSIMVLIFGAIYEYFSFGVYSVYMIYAFAVFLIMGVLLFALAQRSKRQIKLRKNGISLYHFGLSTITAGCLVKGVLEIYGTTNALVRFYWITGTVLTILGFTIACLPSRNQDTNKP